MDKLERLMNLVAVLVDTSVPLTAEELRRQVPGYPEESGPTFHRAFERDKDDLRELGIPIVVERIEQRDPPVDGYRIPPERYFLEDPGLEPDELAAVQLAMATIDLGELDGTDGLWRLGGQVEAPALPVAQIAGDANLGRLFGAVTDRRTVEFDYRGERRRVDPGQLDYRNGRWYLAGHDHARAAGRSFRLDRIDGTVTVDADAPPFDQPEARPSVAPAPWELGGEGDEEAVIDAELRVDPERVSRARQILGPEVGEEVHDDESVTFVVPVTNRSGFRSLVLSFLDRAEVVGPPDLRTEIVDWLAGLATAGEAS